MKKIISILLITTAVFILTACNTSYNNESNEIDPSLLNQTINVTLVTREDITVLLEPSLALESRHHWFRDGLSNVQLTDGRLAFVNIYGEVVIDLGTEFDRVHGGFNEGLAWIRNADGLYGAIDTNGDFVIPFKFDNAERFSVGLAAVSYDGLWGFINREGEVVIDFQYVRAFSFSNVGGTASVDRTNPITGRREYGRIGTDGNVVMPFNSELRPMGQISSGYFRVRCGGQTWGSSWGLADHNGNIVLPLEFDDMFPPHRQSGLIIVTQDGKRGVIDERGNIVVPVVHENLRWVHGVLGSVEERDGQTGFVDLEGNIIVPFEFDGIRSSFDGILWVERNGKFGAVNTNNETIIDFEFDGAGEFNYGVSWIQRDGLWGIIRNNTYTEAD